MSRVLALLATLGSIDATGNSRAVPVPGLNVTAMAQQADIVLLGTVVRITETGHGYVDRPNGAMRLTTAVAEIRVHQVLKGSLGTPSVEVDFESSFDLGYGSVVQNESGLLFLTRADETYRFVSPYDPVHLQILKVPFRGLPYLTESLRL